MNPEWALVIMAAVTVVSHGINVMLYLRIRLGQLESERRVLREVERLYVPKSAGHERRIIALEEAGT